MSNVILIPKWDGSDDMRPAWVDTFDPSGHRVRPHIICTCGDATDISNHHIHADGRITASYLHKFPDGRGCGWHEFLQMQGWEGGELKPGEYKTK